VVKKHQWVSRLKRSTGNRVNFSFLFLVYALSDGRHDSYTRIPLLPQNNFISEVLSQQEWSLYYHVVKKHQWVALKEALEIEWTPHSCFWYMPYRMAATTLIQEYRSSVRTTSSLTYFPHKSEAFITMVKKDQWVALKEALEIDRLLYKRNAFFKVSVPSLRIQRGGGRILCSTRHNA
jgi:hypothetical protein